MLHISVFNGFTFQDDKTLHWTWGGFQEARGAPDGKEWYVENIFEELDVANEWFYDEVTQKIYYFPNGTEANLPEEVCSFYWGYAERVR